MLKAIVGAKALRMVVSFRANAADESVSLLEMAKILGVAWGVSSLIVPFEIERTGERFLAGVACMLGVWDTNLQGSLSSGVYYLFSCRRRCGRLMFQIALNFNWARLRISCLRILYRRGKRQSSCFLADRPKR